MHRRISLAIGSIAVNKADHTLHGRFYCLSESRSWELFSPSGPRVSQTGLHSMDCFTEPQVPADLTLHRKILLSTKISIIVNRRHRNPDLESFPLYRSLEHCKQGYIAGLGMQRRILLSTGISIIVNRCIGALYWPPESRSS